ncbi:MAG: ABC transporter ATP-binding protein [Christensenellaceae bacterium]|nr:ABC transporter ATP-binding protein [Christensenellaceae bacterium]
MIQVSNLSKSYAAHKAVSDLSFTVEDGRIYGLLGPNGAGKTTTMNMLTGYIAPSSGKVVIDGFDIFEDAEEAKKRVGYLPEQPPLYPNMTVKEYLTFVAELKFVKAADVKDQVGRAIEKTGLGDAAGRLIRNLSKGYKQRVGIAQALVGDPKIIILDEPTVGLDPKQIIEIRELIVSLKEEHTVILSSHILQEVAAVCDHIMILSHGKLVAQDTPENLSKRMKGSGSVKVTARGEFENIAEAVKEIGKAVLRDPEEEGYTTVEILTDSSALARENIFLALSGADIPAISIVQDTASLEEIFLELTGDEKEDNDESSL